MNNMNYYYIFMYYIFITLPNVPLLNVHLSCILRSTIRYISHLGAVYIFLHYTPGPQAETGK